MKTNNKETSTSAGGLKYLIALTALAVADSFIGNQISLWYFSLIPVGLAAWNHGKPVGSMACIYTCILLFADAIFFGGPYTTTSFALFAALGRALIVIAFVVLILQLRAKEVERLRVGSGQTTQHNCNSTQQLHRH